jgi:hypothetical protein
MTFIFVIFDILENNLGKKFSKVMVLFQKYLKNSLA